MGSWVRCGSSSLFLGIYNISMHPKTIWLDSIGNSGEWKFSSPFVHGKIEGNDEREVLEQHKNIYVVACNWISELM